MLVELDSTVCRCNNWRHCLLLFKLGWRCCGVVGLAVGYGAQNLVKDVIIFEDQMHVGT
jgi:hypothetical protein